jgi:hypothetical protein
LLVIFAPDSTQRIVIQKKRGADIPLLLMKVLRLPVWKKCKQSTLYARTFTLSCHFENFSGFHQQDEHKRFVNQICTAWFIAKPMAKIGKGNGMAKYILWKN